MSRYAEQHETEAAPTAADWADYERWLASLPESDLGDFETPPDDGRVYLCTVCRKSAVDALNGYDTCADCLARQ